MKKGGAFHKSHDLINKVLDCPFCVWVQSYTSRFDLEWHILNYHGRERFLEITKKKEKCQGPFAMDQIRRFQNQKRLVECKEKAIESIHSTFENSPSQKSTKSTEKTMAFVNQDKKVSKIKKRQDYALPSGMSSGKDSHIFGITLMDFDLEVGS